MQNPGQTTSLFNGSSNRVPQTVPQPISQFPKLCRRCQPWQASLLQKPTIRPASQLAIVSVLPTIHELASRADRKAFLSKKSLCHQISCGDNASRSKSFDIAYRWLTEKATVFAVELADALVTDFVRCARSIHPIHEHPLPRPL